MEEKAWKGFENPFCYIGLLMIDFLHDVNAPNDDYPP